MRVLCVAEKPSIAKSISQILSGGQFTTHNTQTNYIKNYEFDYPQTRSFFVVTCVSGHITSHDFYDTHRKWNSCEPFELFDAPVEVKIAAEKKPIEQNLMTQAGRSDLLMIWTDCDREGEHIGMEIVKVCRKAKPGIQVKRARFSAIIAQQIHHAAQHPVEVDRCQANAVEARILLDLKVGAAFTRLQTLALQSQVKEIADEKSIVSYGPCQFPTLGFVVQRYNHVKKFKPESFWYMSLMRQVASQGGQEEVTFHWKRHHLFSREMIVEILRMMMTSPTARVTKVTNKATKKWKPLPLTTVELQKAASRLLKLAPKKALDIAEKLYQLGFVSYPRTETDQFDAQFDHMSLVAKQTADSTWGAFATSLQNGGFVPPRRGKNDDKAHPPIHPTAHANNLTGDDKRVYEYITRRYLACCSKDAEGWQTTVEIVCGGEEFSAAGLIVKEKNYLNVYVYDKWTEHSLPEFTEGEEFEPDICEIREGETSRPNYLTEADLVSLMDKNGIGTDATIAQHIQTIIDRSYVIERMEGATKYLVPSTLGIGLIEGYNHIGLAKNVGKPQLRRETERRMVQVCEGTVTKQEMIERSLDQYKAMFVIVRREFARVTTMVRRCLSGQREGGPGTGGGGDGDGGGGGNRGRDGGDIPPRDGSEGGGRGGRGRGRGRGRGCDTAAKQTAGRGRGRGRGKAATLRGSNAIVANDIDDDFNMLTSNTRAVVPPTYQPGSSSSVTRTSSALSPDRLTKPITIGSNWQARVAPSSSASNKNSKVPDCECGIPAIRKTIDQGNSKGKQYWSCPIQKDGCEFFEYVVEGYFDLATPAASNIPSKRSHSSLGEPLMEKVIRKCLCSQDAVMKTVIKEGSNKGRKFWKCGQVEGACQFWEWDDEPSRSTKSERTSSMGDGQSSSSSEMCFKCQKTGHWAKDCPNETSSKRSRSFGTDTNNSAAIDAECYKCRKMGHFANACPSGSNGSKSSYAGEGANSTDECFKCGKTGHWSSNCPSSSYTKRSYSESNTSTKRGRGSGRGRGRGGKKKSAFAAADDR